MLSHHLGYILRCQGKMGTLSSCRKGRYTAGMPGSPELHALGDTGSYRSGSPRVRREVCELGSGSQRKGFRGTVQACFDLSTLGPATDLWSMLTSLIYLFLLLQSTLCSRQPTVSSVFLPVNDKQLLKMRELW